MEIMPLAIAEKIFNDGRIEDEDDWEEMKLELEFELDNLEILTSGIREQVLKAVQDYWY